MKRASRLFAPAAIALLVLASCEVFIFSANDLKGKTFTYYVNMTDGSTNGHDTVVLAFNAAGDGGTFTTAGYIYDYPTQAAFAAGTYTGKTWFQNSGMSGTFTYNTATGAFSLATDHRWGRKQSATAIHDDVYAAADYESQTLNDYYSIFRATTVTDAVYSMTRTCQINADNIVKKWNAGSSANTWVNTSSQTESWKEAAGAMGETDAMTDTVTISDGVLDIDSVTTCTYADGSTGYTDEKIGRGRIVNSFLVGKEDASMTFADKWKKDNTVTFQIEETEYDDIWHQTGTTVPTRPTNIGIDGIGETITGTGAYYVDMNINYFFSMFVSAFANPITLKNEGDCILSAGLTVSAVRSIAGK